jgi:DNA-binding transcriptional MerR regulator
VFGSKKGKEYDKAIPLDRVRAMNRSGLSDKDIIKQLKSEGYSYGEIEKAMLQSVKEGVAPEPFAPVMSRPDAEVPRSPSMPNFEEEFFSDRNSQDLMEDLRPEASETGLEPEVVMEELIEEVVGEKVAKYEDRIKRMEDTIAMLKAEIKHSSDIMMTTPAESGTAKEMDDRLEELEARIGGLEKAFKQFLPSLTKNIESLSDMIHEMKEKRGLEAEAI